MSKEKRRVPKLRFPGFTEDWEQRKLNDFVTIRRGLTYKPSDIAENGIRVLRSSNIDEDQFIKSNDDVFVNLAAVNIPFAKNGDILITSANGSNRLVGKHTIINDVAENSAVPGGFMLLAESNNPLFTDALLSSNWYKRFINTYVAGGNGAIGNLNKSDLESQSVMVPSEHEQTKIGQWYDNINQLITLHQRKLNNLKLKKKALLQKLFPKNGERYPELRFPGFTDAWEQRKFGELFILKSGVAFKLSEYTKTGIPIINGESIKAGKISLEKINYLPNEYQYKYQECLLFPGDIVLGLNRPIIDGTLKISRIPADIKKSLLYQRAGKIIFKVNMDENFTYQLLSKEVLTFTKKEAVGSDQPFITTTKLNKWDLYFPVKDKERRNIGSLFNNIDNIITLHQRKLDHLQLQKKALLQQMFV